MKTPSSLGRAGKALHREMIAALPAGWQYDERELAILAAACHQADDLASLQRTIKRDGTMVTGSIGQRRLHPAVVEVRQGRIALARLLGELSLPDEATAKGQTAASRRGQHAADKRWQAVASKGAPVG